MANNAYHFITRWRVKSTCEEISDVLGKAEDLPRWWPAVYLGVETLEPGEPDGLNKVTALYTKGWLPYTLRWQFRVTEVRGVNGFSLEASGDFVGCGIWSFEQHGEYVNLTYDWKIMAEKPLLRDLSFFFKPIFAASHEWAMRKGLESLGLELARRQAKTAEELARIRAPPPPTFIRSSPARQRWRT